MTTSESKSATARPPMTAMASGCKSSAPAPMAKASGNIPKIAASEVINTGGIFFDPISTMPVAECLPLRDALPPRPASICRFGDDANDHYHAHQRDDVERLAHDDSVYDL